MKKTLTVVGIESLKEGLYWDSVCKGLHLRVGKNRKTWMFKYRQGGKQLTPVLGYFPKEGLAKARDLAGDIIKRLEAGAPAIAEPVEHPTAEKHLTLGELLDKYETHRRVGGGKRIKSLGEAMRVMRKAMDTYLPLAAKQFKKADLIKCHDSFTERGKHIAANRFLAYTSRFMNWAVGKELLAANYCIGLEKTAEKKRDVFLTDAEIRAVWHACNVMENTMGNLKATRSFARLIRFQMCVPSRRGESATLRLQDVTQDGFWRMDEHKTAEVSDTEHMLLLPPLARAQFEGHRDLGNGEPGQLCFPGHRAGKPLSGWSRLMNELRSLAGIEKHFTIHDLRRTGASHLQDMGMRKDFVDMLLNHAVEGIGGVYMQAQMTAYKAEALRVWNEKLQCILDNRPTSHIESPLLINLPTLSAAA